MGLIDFILNLAGVLLWLSWRSIRSDPLVKTRPATLIGTLRRAEPRRMKGWQLLAGLVAAAAFAGRALSADRPGSGLDAQARPFLCRARLSDRLPPGHSCRPWSFSLLSFARMLIIGYFWLLALVVINRRNAEPDPLHKMLRLHLGPVARWPLLVQVLLPLVLITGLWMALHPLLAHLEITGRVRSNAHLAEQGLLIRVAVLLHLAVSAPGVPLAALVRQLHISGEQVPCGISSGRPPAICWRRCAGCRCGSPGSISLRWAESC